LNAELALQFAGISDIIISEKSDFFRQMAEIGYTLDAKIIMMGIRSDGK